MTFCEWDTIQVSGRVSSAAGEVYVKNLEAVVATVYPETHPDFDFFKVWPSNCNDPQLPPSRDGKLWFRRSETSVKVISDADGNSVGNR